MGDKGEKPVERTRLRSGRHVLGRDERTAVAPPGALAQIEPHGLGRLGGRGARGKAGGLHRAIGAPPRPR